ncbi:hypothetical protein DFJ43DRAFT_1162382 [Lentinula guzmanii]|uniref:Uncharacterized protein n=1 Tax=Lentinula guzmanii TaxID=2804957 RepID=A0AA38JCN7_9AGAR|nr:hypothetical protein DFJ43DRAFT_1162382 [Lentinula guzmanii]
MSIVLQRREDGKMPCACSAESHARFNFVKVFNMIRKVIHPAPNDPGYDDIPFQQSTPPRPPSNPIDPTSMAVYTSAALQLSSGGVPPPQAPTSIVGSPIPPILPLQPSTAIVSPPRSPDSPMSDMNIREEPEESMDVDSEQENVTEDEQQEDGQGIGSEYIPDGQESDSDDGGEDVDMDSAVENLPPSASQNIDSCRSFLLQYGIQVDPIYRFVNIYHHKQRKHYQNTKQILRTRLPPAPEILAAITSLGGHRPSPPDPLNGPIDPIVGVEVVNGIKCTIGDCHGHVHVNRESMREHQVTHHPMVPVRNRSSVNVKCQSLNTVKQYRSYIEVQPPPSTKFIPKGLELVLESAEACNLLKQDDVSPLLPVSRKKPSEQLSCFPTSRRTILPLAAVQQARGAERSSIRVTKFLEDDRFCPFTRFLVAAHLKPHGQFVRANVISPFIGYIQWSLRATAAKKLISISHELGGDYLAAFDTLREFISEGKQVLFNSLRQSMHLISSIAYRQQGLARFLWSPDRKTLSIDGFPVHIPTFLKNIQRTLLTTIERVQTLFRGCEYLDILDHIDQGMVPDEVGQTRWFRDQENGLEQFSDRLLLHLIEKTNLFGWVDGKLVANRRRVSDWFSELDQIVRELFYLVVTTWGGGARGTEMEKLLFANHLRNTRNVFFINGFLTFITEYSKTQSITGAGRIIARTPAFQVNRLLILIILVAYKAAGYLNCYMGADKMACTPYFYDVFVCRGSQWKAQSLPRPWVNITESMQA